MVQEEKAFRAASSLFRFGIIALLILGSLSLKSCFKEPKPEPVVVEEPKQTPPKPGTVERTLLIMAIEGAPYTTEWIAKNQRQKVEWLIDHQGQVINILRIINLIQDEAGDINGDGLSNCIDYAIIFRIFYGPEARLIQNNNPTTGMNHLFIKIADSRYGDWYVEPRGTYNQWQMPDVWGQQYNSSYNIDVTYRYEQWL